MKTVRLGKTDLYVSKIGIGGIPIQRPSEDKAIKVIQRALDLGVTFLDTSRAYRTSEERIGKAVAGCRDQVVIATKAGWQDKITALTHLEESLQHLNTDYIDLWQFHNVSTLEGFERLFKPDGAMEAAQDALRAGKIRHVGISSHSPIVAQKAVISGQFETIMFPFNFVARELAEELVPLTREHDIGFIAMKPFAGGMLQDANLSIKYLLQFENVMPIPGIEKIEEVEQIVDIVNGSWELTVQERQEMEEIRTKMDTQICRRCGYCQPCSEKVGIIPLVNMASLWKLWPREALHPEDNTRFSQFLANFVESGRNCTQCGECEEKCPYHLPIREMITENVEFYENIIRG
ncbi:MAG: aldo/keto reductase [Candidatus Hermodarchaeota archaeon]